MHMTTRTGPTGLPPTDLLLLDTEESRNASTQVPSPSEGDMMPLILSVVLQLAALAIQGIQCWLDARRRSSCPGHSGPRATLPTNGRGRQGQHRRR